MRVKFEYMGHHIIVTRGLDTVELKIDGETQKIIQKNGIMNRITNTTLEGEILSGVDKGIKIRVKIITGLFTDDAIFFYDEEKICKKTMFAI